MDTPTITLVRHGESQQNVGQFDVQRDGDFRVQLTETGKAQAAALCLPSGIFTTDRSSVIYCSPYTRTRQTLAEMAGPALSSLDVFEDPRLREVEHGYYDYEQQTAQRERHGWFYYRFRGGESPADCYDRTCTFLESMWRRVGRRENCKHVLIVSHGLTMRCFLMRFLHLSVEQFEDLANPPNCGVIQLIKSPTDKDGFERLNGGRWLVGGNGFGWRTG